MAVVLLKVFEEANLSGELKLSGRKLRDFPKAAGKYNLSDTVIADLSRNRFCELPEDVTGFPFLETLIMYSNSIRTIPDTIRGLYSLTFLDLRSNLLSVLPREICFLPIQVLLVSNNRLVSLPDELGRMERLTELDAACNQITHLPARLSDLKNLRSLSLRNNHLVYLSRDLCHLHLITLDVSCNRIASLPVELRLMTELVDLKLQNNPLTSPPASLCVRGLVHVFKYLDTMALKEEKSRTTFDGNTTLRRNANTTKVTTRVIDNQKTRQQHADSGYSTSDGIDKRLCHDLAPNGSTPDTDVSKWSPTAAHNRTLTNENVSPSTPNSTHSNSFAHDILDSSFSPISKGQQSYSNGANNNSTEVSPDGDNTPDSQKSSDRLKSILGNVQTYREYKEALRQQRNQDSNAIYRPKDQSTPPSDGSPSILDSPTGTFTNTSKTNLSATISSNSLSSTHLSQTHYQTSSTSLTNGSGGGNGAVIGPIINDANTVSNKAYINSIDLNNGGITSPNKNDKPVQKVIPSRNATPVKYQMNASPATNWIANGNQTMGEVTAILTKDTTSTYIKPSSPLTAPNTGSLCYNNVPSIEKTPKVAVTKNGAKPTRTVSWNRDIPPEKLSFTMRRELDRHKEEKELIEQLRTIIESRLKMSLPKDIASALTDGVVLCHLANYIRPRSVATIHVPSAAVPKLTMARCRRNVDNFLDACRKIGVDEELICSCADIVPPDEPSRSTTATTAPMNHESTKSTASSGVLPPNPAAMHKTIGALLEIIDVQNDRGPSSTTIQTTATNTKTHINTTAEEIENYNNYFKSVGIHFQKAAACFIEQPLSQSSIKSVEACDGPNQIIDHANELIDEMGNSLTNINDNCTNPIKDSQMNVVINSNDRVRLIRQTPKTLDLFSTNDVTFQNGIVNASKKRKLINTRYNFNQLLNEKYYSQFPLNEIVEECSYDSDIGKFNCNPSYESSVTSDSNSSIDMPEKSLSACDQIVINNLDSPMKPTVDVPKKDYKEKFNIQIDDTGLSDVTKKMTNFLGTGDVTTSDKIQTDHFKHDYSSILCLTAFFTSAIWLYFFPLPN